MGFDLSDYETVDSRIHRFWERHPGGRILTEIIAREDALVIVRAEVYADAEDDRPSATGVAQEVAGSSPVNRTSHVENCETSAIGRALANYGLSPHGSRPSREEMAGAQAREDAPGDPIPTVADPPVADPDAPASDAQRKVLVTAALEADLQPDQVVEIMRQRAGVERSQDLRALDVGRVLAGIREGGSREGGE